MTIEEKNEHRINRLMDTAHVTAAATSRSRTVARDVEKCRLEAAEQALADLDPEDRVLVKQSADRIADSHHRISQRVALETLAALGAFLAEVLGDNPDDYEELEEYVRKRQIEKGREKADSGEIDLLWLSQNVRM